jgi:hypothetical protein
LSAATRIDCFYHRSRRSSNSSSHSHIPGTPRRNGRHRLESRSHLSRRCNSPRRWCIGSRNSNPHQSHHTPVAHSYYSRNRIARRHWPNCFRGSSLRRPRRENRNSTRPLPWHHTRCCCHMSPRCSCWSRPWPCTRHRPLWPPGNRPLRCSNPTVWTRSRSWCSYTCCRHNCRTSHRTWSSRGSRPPGRSRWISTRCRSSSRSISGHHSYRNCPRSSRNQGCRPLRSRIRRKTMNSCWCIGTSSCHSCRMSLPASSLRDCKTPG